MAGLELDPWEEFVLANSLGEREDGSWAAFETGVCVSRQNGKGAILEARELAGLFLLGERLIIHSAHLFDTSLEAFRRLRFLIEEHDEFSRRVKRISQAHGEEGIELVGGQRVRFRTRTKGGGRGFTGDCLILDEAMEIAESAHGALLPTLSARPNPQVWYTGSAVDQWTHDHGVVFARVRERGLAGDDRLAWFEWCIDVDNPEAVTDEMARDPELWAQANPGLGIRISEEHIANEQRSMAARNFAVERLGAGDWPSTDGSGDEVLNPERWVDGIDVASEVNDPICMAFDVSPDRSKASVSAAGRRDDNRVHGEVIDRHPGTNWLVERMIELDRDWRPDEIICDGASPAASFVAELEAEGIEVTMLTAKEYARACGRFFDLVDGGEFVHLDTPELNEAVKGAAKRPVGDAWAWARKTSTVDITPLCSVTLAAWGVVADDGPSPWERRSQREEPML